MEVERPNVRAYIESDTIELMTKTNVGNKIDMLMAKAEELCRLIEKKGLKTYTITEHNGSRKEYVNGVGVALRPISYRECGREIFRTLHGQLNHNIADEALTLNAKVDMTNGVEFFSMEVTLNNETHEVIKGSDKICRSPAVCKEMKAIAQAITDAGYV